MKDYSDIVIRARKRKLEEEDNNSSSSRDYYDATDTVEKTRLKKMINFDTFDSDLQNTGSAISDIYNGWQTQETLNNTRASVESMYKRLNDLNTYESKYGSGDVANLSDILGGYQSVLDEWDTIASTYSSYKDADSYTKERTRLGELNSMSMEDIEKYLDGENSIAYTTVSGQDITWKSLYDDKKRTQMATSEEGVKGWEKYLLDKEEANKKKEEDADSKKWYEKALSYLGNSPDTTLPSATMSQVIDDKRKDTSYQEPTDDWTEEEKRIFGAYYLEDEASAYQYAKELNNSKAKAKKDESLGKIEDSATSGFWAGAGHTAGAIATAPLGLADYLDDLTDMVSGRGIVEEEFVSPFEYSQAVTGGISKDLNERYGTLNENIPIIGGKGLGDVYGLGTSIVQSTASAYTLGGVGTLISYFGQGASEGVDDALSRGATEDQALIYGTIRGLAEGAMESIGVDRLLKIGSSETLKELLVNVLKQAGAEGMEEMLTSVAGNVADNFVLQDNSNFNRAVRQLQAQGLSEEEAKKKAWMDTFGDIAYDTLAGMVSGGVHAGPQTAVQTVRANNQNKDIGQNLRNNDRVEDMIGMYDFMELQGATTEGSATSELFAQYGKKGVNADNIKNAQLGNLYNTARQEALDTINSPKATDAQKTDAVSRLKKLDQMQTVKQSKVTSTGEVANIEGIKDGGATIVTSAGEISADDMTLSAKDSDKIYYAKSMGDEKGNVFLSMYDGKSNIEEFAHSFELAYNYGEALMDDSVVLENKGALTEAQALEAYKAGVKNRNSAEEIQLQKAVDEINQKYASKTFVKGTVDDSIIDYDGTSTDGSKVRWKNLSKRQRNAVTFVKAFSEATGMNVKFIQSDVVNGKRVGKNGSYNRETNTIEIDVYAGIINASSIKDSIIPTTSHEMTHWMKNKSPQMFANISEYVLDTLTLDGKMTRNDLIAKEMDRIKKNHPEMKVTEDMAIDELVARACEDMLANSNEARKMLNRMSTKEQNSFIAKVKETFQNLMQWVNDLLKQYKSESDEAKILREYRDRLKELSKMWDKALTEAVKTNQSMQEMSSSEQATINRTLNEIGLEYDADTGTVYSMRSLEEAFDYNKSAEEYMRAREEYVNALVKATGRTKADANRYLDSLFLVHDMIANDTARLDYESAVGRSAWVSNVEYGGSIDFSTLCAKRRLFTGTMDAIHDALPDAVLNENDFLTIRNMLLEKDLESPCSMCYVEGSRAKADMYIKQWLDEYLATDPVWKPRMRDFASATRLNHTRINHPEAYKSYQEAMNKLSQRKPKEASVRTDYKGEILVAFEDGTSVKIKNENGGIRFNSFSDFEIIHALDCMQVITDMARVGLAGQGYTKVKEFAECFGKTGLKINLSLVAKGVDKNGRLVFDEVNGMKYADAMELRNKYSDNVGTVIVAFTNEQIKSALADPTIDYVLPFHRSQWKKAQYALMGLPVGTKDYTNVQNDRIKNPNTGRAVKLDKIKAVTKYTNTITGETYDIKGNIMPNMYWDYSKSGRENAQEYLNYINANKMTPKFQFLLQREGNNWVLPEDAVGDGYFKLLIDFKMYDNNGVGSPQMPVVPEFNMPFIQQMLEDYKGGHQSFPVAHDVVDEFVNGYKKKHQQEQYSDRESIRESMTDEKRYNILKNRHISVTAKVDSKKMEEAEKKYKISGAYALKETDRKKLFKKIGEEFGVFKEYENRDVKLSFVFSKGNMSESESKQKGNYDLFAKMFSCFDDVIESAVGIEVHNRNKEGYKTDVTLKSVYVLVSAFEDGESIVPVKLEIKEFYDKSNTLYVAIALESIKKDEVVKEGDIINDVTQASRPSNISLSDLFASINPSDERFLKYVPKQFFERVTVVHNDSGESFAETSETLPHSPLENTISQEAENATTLEQFSDRDYMDAVNRGDMETAQKMVDEKALSLGARTFPNGKLKNYYHGTNADFSSFDYEKAREGNHGFGFYFSPMKSKAEDYKTGSGRLISAYLFTDNLATIDKHNLKASDVEKILNDFNVPIEEQEWLWHGYDSIEKWLEEESDRVAIKEIESRIYRNSDASVADILRSIRSTLGYDGIQANNETILFDNTLMKSADAVTYDDSGKVIPLSERFNEKNDDIRYSDRDNVSVYEALGEDERIASENAKIREDFERLKATINAEEVDLKKFRSLADYIKKLAGSNYSKEILADELMELYTMIQTDKDLQWSDVMVKAYDIANSMINLNPEVSANYFREVMSSIRKDKVTLSAEQRAEAEKMYGGYGNFHRATFGRVSIVNDGTPLDQMWAEWSKKYPTVFKADIKGIEQIKALVEIMDALKATSSIMGEYEREEAIRHLGTEIYNQMWNIASDKSDAVVKVKSSHRQMMEDLRKEYEQRQKEKTLHPVGETALKYEKILRKVMERDKAELKRAKELGKKRMDNYKEQAERKAKIQSIKTKTRKLEELLIKNSKEKHISEDLKPMVRKLIQAIDYETSAREVRQFDQMGYSLSPTEKEVKAINDSMKNVAEARNDQKLLYSLYEVQKKLDSAEFFGLGLEGKIEELIGHLEGLNDAGNYPLMVLNAMSLDQLDTINKLVGAVSKVVSNANKLHTTRRNMSADSLGGKITNYLDKLGVGTVYAKSLGKYMKMFKWSNTVPYYAFKRLGEGGLDLFKLLQDGWSKLAFNINEIMEFANATYTEKDAKEWGSEIKEITVEGKKIQMTVPQIMSLYCLYQREQGRKHILGHGIKIGDIEVGKKMLNQADDYTVSEQDVANIISLLSDKQLEVAKKIQKFMNDVCSEWGNYVSMERFGYKAFEEENYFPIKVDPNNLKQDKIKDNKNVSLYALLNMGFTKSVNEEAKNAVMIEDIFDVFANHASEMAKYNALGLAVLDLNRVMNYSVEREGKPYSIRTAMESAYGKDAYMYFSKFMADLNGTQNTSRDVIGKTMMSKAKIGAIGWNIKTVLLQPTAYLKASAIIAKKHLLNAVVSDPRLIKRGVDRAKKYCGIALWKSLGFYDTNVSRGVVDQIKHKKTWTDTIAEKSTKWMGKADEFTFGLLWNACELDVKSSRTDLKVGSDEFYQAVADRLEEVVYATQVVDSTITRSEMMRSGDFYDKMLTAFGSEPILAYNMLLDCVMETSMLKRSGASEDVVKNNKRKVARVLDAYIATNLVTAILEAFVSAFREDDELEEGEIIKMILQNFASNMSVIGKIPYLKDIVSLFSGYSASRMDMQGFQSAVYAYNSFKKNLKGEGNVATTIKHSMKAYSSLMGIPIFNPYRDATALFDKLGILTYEELEDLMNEILD